MSGNINNTGGTLYWDSATGEFKFYSNNGVLTAKGEGIQVSETPENRIHRASLDRKRESLAQFTDLFGPQVEPLTQWRDREGKIWFYKDMPIGYLRNCIAMLERNENSLRSKRHLKWMRMEVASRLRSKPTESVTHTLEITEEDIIELARIKGSKIPKTGASVYVLDNGTKRRGLPRITVEFTVDRPLKARKGKK